MFGQLHLLFLGGEGLRRREPLKPRASAHDGARVCPQGYNQWLNDVVEWWRGSQRKQSYSYLIQRNITNSFTWGFQHAGENHEVGRRHASDARFFPRPQSLFIPSQGRNHSGDVAKIYSVHVANVIGGVASRCRRCAATPGGYSSACVPCPPGHYMVSGTGACESCPPNTIIRADQAIGADACVPCGPNTERNEVKRQKKKA